VLFLLGVGVSLLIPVLFLLGVGVSLLIPVLFLLGVGVPLLIVVLSCQRILLLLLLFNYCGLLGVTLVHKGLQVVDYLYWAFVKGLPFCRLILVLLTMWAACVLSRAPPTKPPPANIVY
jgi:hypothetical protein